MNQQNEQPTGKDFGWVIVGAIDFLGLIALFSPF